MTDTNPLKPGFWMTDEARGHSERFRAMTRDTLTMLIQHAEQLRDHGRFRRADPRALAEEIGDADSITIEARDMALFKDLARADGLGERRGRRRRQLRLVSV